ncbi:hypothetical protein ABZ863_18735 [Saccharomonospora sp. NPDC046836]|uniref:hypothetical protein n=1 Tax=Saccharomonospora sp. NPDC046836 TaxID=3156921 RepID=UPI0033DF3223
MTNDVEAQLKAELRELCQRWGLRRPRLRDHIGGHIGAWATVSRTISDEDARQQIVRALARLPPDDFPETDRVIVRAAMALDGDFQFSSLGKRTAFLAEELKVSPRTARRRIDIVLDRLAAVIASAIDPDDLDTGWAVERLAALVRLDGDEPEVIERRTITATRAGLQRIRTRFTLPVLPSHADASRKVEARILQGARITAERRVGNGHFEHVLELPQALDRGEELTYEMSYRVVDGQPIRPYYAMVPSIACAALNVKIRFAVGREPRMVWLLDRLHHRALLDLDVPPGPIVEVDGAGEVGANFTALRPGFGYGIAWSATEP